MDHAVVRSNRRGHGRSICSGAGMRMSIRAKAGSRLDIWSGRHIGFDRSADSPEVSFTFLNTTAMSGRFDPVVAICYLLPTFSEETPGALRGGLASGALQLC